MFWLGNVDSPHELMSQQMPEALTMARESIGTIHNSFFKEQGYTFADKTSYGHHLNVWGYNGLAENWLSPLARSISWTGIDFCFLT